MWDVVLMCFFFSLFYNGIIEESFITVIRTPSPHRSILVPSLDTFNVAKQNGGLSQRLSHCIVNYLVVCMMLVLSLLKRLAISMLN